MAKRKKVNNDLQNILEFAEAVLWVFSDDAYQHIFTE
jgi:hypothetical protein